MRVAVAIDSNEFSFTRNPICFWAMKTILNGETTSEIARDEYLIRITVIQSCSSALETET